MTRPTPRETPDRCALRAQARDDPMLGTAFPAGRLLLVEQPGSWGPDGLTESDFDHRVAHELRSRADGAGVRLQAIRRPGRPSASGDRHWALADCRSGRESLRWGTYAHDRDLLSVPLDGSAGAPDYEPAYLVCTHGRHDPCCALRGRPVAAALAELRPGRVWETSHVGGDRFAANVLVLPSGALYGRVAVDDASALVAAVDDGRLLIDHLRGRVGLSAPAQTALAFAHRHLGLDSGLRVRSATPVRDGRATVHVDGPDGELVVAVRVERRAAAGLTCENPRPNAFLVYTAAPAD